MTNENVLSEQIKDSLEEELHATAAGKYVHVPALPDRCNCADAEQAAVKVCGIAAVRHSAHAFGLRKPLQREHPGADDVSLRNGKSPPAP